MELWTVIPICKTKTLLPFCISILFLMKINLTSTFNKDVLELMKRHISILGEEIWQYFSELEDFQKYRHFVNNPFGMNVGDLPLLGNLLQEEFVDLVNDENARSLLSEKSCSDFWIETRTLFLSC